MKLKTHILDKMISYTIDENTGKVSSFCTSSEINLFLYLVRLQDDTGYVKDVFYKFACEEIGEKMSISNFFKILESLQQKGLIRISNTSDYGYWDLYIVENSFFNKDYSGGYINLNRKLLLSTNFLKAPWGIKVIILHMLSNYRETTHMQDFKLSTLMRWTGFNSITIKRYILKLKSIFKEVLITKIISKGKRELKLIFSSYEFFDNFNTNENEGKNKNFLNVLLRKNKQADKKNCSDKKSIIKLIQQYANYPRALIEDAVTYCLKKNKFDPKYINHIIQRMLKGTFNYN